MNDAPFPPAEALDPLSHGPAIPSGMITATIDAWFPRAEVTRILERSGDPAYRARSLTIELVFFGLLRAVVCGWPSFAVLVSRIRAGLGGDFGPVSVTPSAFYQRLADLPHGAFLAVLRQLVSRMGPMPASVRAWVTQLAPFATGVYAIDDTTLDALARKTRALAALPRGAHATLGGRLGAALDLRTGELAAVLYDADSDANERNHLLPLLEALGSGALVVLDLGYFSFPLFDAISERFTYFVTRMHAPVTYVVRTVLADRPLYRDRVVWLGAHKDRGAHPVRLVEVKLDGVWHAWLTNVLDPRMLPAPNVWALYAQRWSIETAFAAIKRALGLASLRPSHANGVLIQVWCTLCVYQVLQRLRVQIAAEHGWDADQVSWQRLVQTIGIYPEQRLGALTLEAFLRHPHMAPSLKKAGQRPRTRTELPAAVRASCLPPPAPPPDWDLSSRVPRRHKPTPRTVDTVKAVAGLAHDQALRTLDIR